MILNQAQNTVADVLGAGLPVSGGDEGGLLSNDPFGTVASPESDDPFGAVAPPEGYSCNSLSTMFEVDILLLL